MPKRKKLFVYTNIRKIRDRRHPLGGKPRQKSKSSIHPSDFHVGTTKNAFFYKDKTTRRNMQPKHFIAFDLGATSGRTILGSLPRRELALKELTRFPNAMLRLGSHYHWNIFSLYEHLREGLRAAAREGSESRRSASTPGGSISPSSDKTAASWGSPTPTATPHRRNPRSLLLRSALPRGGLCRNGHPDHELQLALPALRPAARTFVATGRRRRLLFMPDALSYLLTGEMITEYTIASTSSC